LHHATVTERASFLCTRWRRYGHDRLYVSDSSGIKIGYRDLKTGLDHPVEDLYRPLLAELASAYAAGESAPNRKGVVSDSHAPVEAASPWLDLALNEPGHLVRERAIAARADAPVRTTLARVLGVPTEERAWRVGAAGEELVAAELAKVSRKQPAWTALHSVPVGSRGSDIDHLVLGPGGVFTVNAKHHKGADIWVGGETLMVNGSRQPHIRNARHEAERASRLLSAAVGQSVPVHGLVVTVNASNFTVKTPPKPGVTVLYRRQLAKWLLRLGPSLDQDLLNRIWDAARRSTTWEC
jgi:hypothetical protein